MDTTGIRNKKFSTGSGKNQNKTQQLQGEAKKSAVENEKNSTTQDYYSKKVSGPFGGENTGS